MSVICQCPSCKAKYQVGDQYAGRKIKCPKCSAAVNVPAAAPIAPVVVVDSLDADEDMAFAQSADDGLGFLNDDSAVRIHRGERSGKLSASAHESSVLGDELAKSGIAARASASGHRLHGKKKKKSGSGLIIAGIVGGCLAVVGVVGGVIYVNWRAKADGSTFASDDKKSAKPAIDPNVPMLTFTFDWPASERRGATLMVNGDLKEIPDSGPIEIKLRRDTDHQYAFELQRQGYKPIKFSRLLPENDSYIVKDWESESSGIDWEQDFAAAKKLAADQHKNVLIVFDASDAKASAYHSSRFHDSVAISPDFVEQANKAGGYVCVYIDNPEKDEAKKKVHDLNRNKELTKKFRITVFPTVVVTDADARPFGIMEDYTINGVTAFLTLMDKWESDRKTLFAMLDRIKAGGDKPDAGLLKLAIGFLELNKLDGIYQHTIQGWADKLPKGESNEVSEQDANGWMLRFAQAHANPDNAKKEVEEFDRWKARHSFKKHADIGAMLHAVAAVLLVQIGDKEAAKKKCEEAKAFPAKSPQARHLIAEIQRAVSGNAGPDEPFPHGSGSGFCIADGNYVMTNHHVIAEAKKIMVHLNSDEERYPAHLVADNADGDMAILKIDLPQDKNLKPIAFAAKDVKIGDEVCAFGWPGLLSDNAMFTLTNGLISGMDDQEGFLITNCKIEHGNSGGPLCSVAGCCIAGMVSRKTATVGELSESYGMAIPASKLIAFVKESKDKFPSDFFRKIPHAVSTNGSTKLSEVVDRVQRSVVYVENYQ